MNYLWSPNKSGRTKATIQGWLLFLYTASPFFSLLWENIRNKIYHVSCFEAYSSVVLRIFTSLCNHHHHASPKPSIIPNKLCTHSAMTPLSPLRQAPGTTVLLSVSLYLTSLGTSYKWNHGVSILLCLTHFTWRGKETL